MEAARFRDDTQYPREVNAIREGLKNTLGEKAEGHRKRLKNQAQKTVDQWNDLLKSDDAKLPSSEQLRAAMVAWLDRLAPLTLLTLNERLVLMPPLTIADHERLFRERLDCKNFRFEVDPVWSRKESPEEWRIGITNDRGITYGGETTFETQKGKSAKPIPAEALKRAKAAFSRDGLEALPADAFLPLAWSILYTDSTLSKHKGVHIGFPDFPEGAAKTYSGGFGDDAIIKLTRRTQIPPRHYSHDMHWHPRLKCLPWLGGTLNLD